MECVEKVNRTKEIREVFFFDLEKVRYIIKDATGLDVSYAYEDLVFSDDAVFIVQFHKINKHSLFCWFNTECFESERKVMMASLKLSAKLNGKILHYCGQFDLLVDGTDEDSFGLRFHMV